MDHSVVDETLLRRAMTPLGRMVMFLFRHARAPQVLIERLGQLAVLLMQVAEGPNGAAAIAAVLVYLQKVTGQDETEVVMAVQQAVGESVYDEIMFAGERREAKAEQRGLEKGQRGMLLRQLRLRFGELPAAAMEQVNAADVAALDAMAERILGASTLTEVLGNNGPEERGKAPRKAPRRRRQTG